MCQARRTPKAISDPTLGFLIIGYNGITTFTSQRQLPDGLPSWRRQPVPGGQRTVRFSFLVLKNLSEVSWPEALWGGIKPVNHSKPVLHWIKPSHWINDAEHQHSLGACWRKEIGWPQHVLPPHWASSGKFVARAALQPNQAGHYTRPKTRPLKFTFASVDLLFALLNMLSNFLLSLDTKTAKLVCCLVFINLQVSCPQETRQVPNYVFHQSELHRLHRAEGNIVHTMVHWAHQNKIRQTWTEDLVWCLWSPIKVHCSYCPWSSKWP